MKRIVCLGGGPAGLYAAILFKRALPRARVEVYERNRADDTFGWASCSRQDDAGLSRRRPRVARRDRGRLPPTGTTSTCTCGASRSAREARILRHRPQAAPEHPAGPRGRARRRATFEYEVTGTAPFADADLIVASDGVNSRTRSEHAAVFQPDVDVRKCRFIWLGTAICSARSRSRSSGPSTAGSRCMRINSAGTCPR